MTRKLQFFLTALLLMVGVTSAWADDWTLDDESYGRTSNSSEYSWASGWPKPANSTNYQFNCNVNKTGMFVLQKYTVKNLAAVKSLTLKLTSAKDGGGVDALAIWSYGSTNPWPAGGNVAAVAAAVNSIVGVDLNCNTTSESTNTPLVDGGSNKTTVDESYQYATYTISGDNLTMLKNAASGNTFVILITNKTADIKTNSSYERKLFTSGHSTESYRPTLTVTYDKVGVSYGDGTMANYSSFEAARSAVVSSGQDATITVMENQDITSRVNAVSGKTISIVAGVDNVTLTNTMSNTLSFLANDGNKGTLNIGSADHMLTVTNSSSTTNNVVELSGSDANAIINITNVTFSGITSSNGSGIIKSNGMGSVGALTLKDVAFNNCSVTDPNAGIIYNRTNNKTIVSGSLTFTGCTGNNFKLDARIAESGFTGGQVYTIYNNGIALGSSAVVTMSTANRDKYTLVNSNQCVVPKMATSNEEMVVSEAYTLTVGAAEAATLVLPYSTTIPAGASCYTLSYTSGNDVTATPVETTLDADKPVLVTASEGTYKFNRSERKPSGEGSTEKTGSGRTSAYGVLVGNYDADYVVPTDNYILTNHSGVVGFRKANGTTNKVQANRAYMSVTHSAGAREFFGIDFGDGETTAINKVDVEKKITGEVYNLQGVRMQGENLPKGIYVRNGKKFVVK